MSRLWGGAGQGELVDVGGAGVGGPAVDMVGFTPVARRGAAGFCAPAVLGVEHDPLPSGGESFRPAQIQGFFGVVIEHRQ